MPAPWDPALELATLTEGDPVLSVAGVSAYIQTLVEEDPYLRRLWITGEVSSYSPHRKGHLFLSLTDPQSGDVLKAVVWGSQVPRLTFWPRVGQQVIVLGHIRTYGRGSTYQCQVWDILPAGEGLLALRYQQLKSRLAAEGLFDPELKQPLPPHPQCVAVVSSPQAAGWGDIQRTAQSRYPGLLVLLSPATVQGDSAPVSIVQAIARVVRDQRAEVLIVARGGGAAEDLGCFNDERVVRAIADCPIPVITGLGHQRDETLADWAADVWAHTPTAAAEQAIPDLSQIEQRQARLSEQLHQVVTDCMADQARHLLDLRSTLQALQVDRLLDTRQQDLKTYQQALQRAVQTRLLQADHHHHLLHSQLQALDPQAILKRGYARVRTEAGTWIRTPEVADGSVLILELASAQLRVRVEATLTES